MRNAGLRRSPVDRSGHISFLVTGYFRFWPGPLQRGGRRVQFPPPPRRDVREIQLVVITETLDQGPGGRRVACAKPLCVILAGPGVPKWYKVVLEYGKHPI